MDETATDPTEDTAEPSETPDTPEPSARIEPLMGLDAFVAMVALSPWMKAALRRWMLLEHHDPDRYYPHDVWQDFLAQTRQYPVG